MKEQIVLLNYLGHPGSFLYPGCKCWILLLSWTTLWVDDGQINCKQVLLIQDWTTWLWRWKKKNHYCDSCTSKISHSMGSLCLLSVTEYKGKAIVKICLGFEFQTIKNVECISHVASVRLWGTGYMWNLHPTLSTLDLLIPHWGIMTVMSQSCCKR